MANNLILQLETATTSCSVALAENGVVLACKEQNERNIHAGFITLFIEEVMNKAGKTYKDLNAIAISMGPGSYTGLRIGVSTAKGLCYALDIPLIGINTLEAMAMGLIEQSYTDHKNLLFCPMIDARRMEVFTALYNYKLELIEPVNAKIVDELTYADYLSNQKIVFFGDGSDKFKPFYESNPNAQFIHSQNSAINLTQIALRKFELQQIENVAYFEPYYLKDYLVKTAVNKQSPSAPK